MMTKRLVPVLLLSAACGAIDLPCGVPQQVDVAVSAITLGDDCGSSALTPPQNESDGARFADCAAANCGICRASSVQLDIVSQQHTTAKFTVIEVYLFDADTHALVDTLKPSAPTKWDGSSYLAWDENVPSLTNLKAKYTLTAPKRSGAAGLWAPSKPFKTQVVVEVDGQRRTLSGPDAYFEPEVAT
ncbi:MAG: hypothetical protein JNK82_43220 [Myxococcaceae bacterium]|nr:hypothetical protein [Myxococcaceae bacterium]